MILVIFGITGDLSKRYLLPALYRLFKDGFLTDETKIVGLTRQTLTADELFGQVELCINEVDNICDPEGLRKIRANTELVQFDPEKSDDYPKLLEHLNKIEEAEGVCMNRLYYLSLPPELFNGAVHELGEAGLNTNCQHGTATTRLLIEKPFGSDFASAQTLIEKTSKVFKEEQIFRIDHYLAKETVQDILAFRQSNPAIEAMWNSEHISAIDIIAKESLGVGHRVNFYENVGALRDFVQSHLLQLAAVTMMDLPETLSAESIHQAKQRLLASIASVSPTTAVRGQYDGYRQESGNPESSTETFVRLALKSDNPRWHNVRITVLSGKSLDEKLSQIVITFKNPESESSNKLVFQISPNEGIRFESSSEDAALEEATAQFQHQADDSLPHPEAYERVLLDAVTGDRTLFATSDQVLESWRIIEPLLQAWHGNTDGMQTYAAGSAGPHLS